MKSALELTPSHVAFIRDESTTNLNSPGITNRSVSPEAQAVASPDSKLPSANRPGAMVPLTTRLRPATAEALRRAYLEQKLAGKTPDTQQEIVEEAICGWLSAHSFLIDD